MKTLKLLAAIPLLGLTLAQPAAALTDAEKKEFGDFIKEYLIENPEIMLEVQEALERKITEARNQQAKQALENNKQALFHSADDLVLGNPQGDVTIVEFFDYNCGYCKQGLSVMNQILENDGNVRFVLKEWPILGPDSEAVHRVSDAVRKVSPDKYGDFFLAVLGGGRANEEKALDVAVSLGIDEAALTRTMKENPNDGTVRKSHELALQLGFTGTPAYIVGDETLPGAYGLEAFNRKIDNLRNCGTATC